MPTVSHRQSKKKPQKTVTLLTGIPKGVDTLDKIPL